MLGHLVVDREQPVVHGQSHGHGGDRLAGAVERVHLLGLVGGGMPLADDLAVAQHHQVMHVDLGQVGQVIDKRVDQLAAHALVLGMRTRQVTRLAP